MSDRSSETIFGVEEAAESGFVAGVLRHCIFTEADDLATLRDAVRDAVRCHFDAAKRAKVIRLCGMRLPPDLSGRGLAKALPSRVTRSPVRPIATAA